MYEKNIESIAICFRNAILKAKYGGMFESKDRMSRFPNGCCDDASDLFAKFLSENHGIDTKQESGTYRDSNPYNTAGHAWLVARGDTIIDITADQFSAIPCNDFGIYVGERIQFYKSLDRFQKYENCNILKNERLLNDYNLILRMM